jgi:hypothetical protein
MAILRSLPGARPTLEPIEWKPYEGETVNTHLTIRKGKKYRRLHSTRTGSRQYHVAMHTA